MNGFIYGLAWSFICMGILAVLILICYAFGSVARFGERGLPPPEPRSVVPNIPTRTVTPFKVQ